LGDSRRRTARDVDRGGSVRAGGHVSAGAPFASRGWCAAGTADLPVTYTGYVVPAIGALVTTLLPYPAWLWPITFSALALAQVSGAVRRPGALIHAQPATHGARGSGRDNWSSAARLSCAATPALLARRDAGLAIRRACRRLVAHACEHIPFYRERYRQAGFEPGDLRTWGRFSPAAFRDQGRGRRQLPRADVARRLRSRPSHRLAPAAARAARSSTSATTARRWSSTPSPV